MKSAYIIHGWDGNPDEPLLQWLKTNLEAKGVAVVVPAMPEPSTPKIEPWVATIAEISTPNEDSLYIGHSVGCQAVLRYIATLPAGTRIAGIVLIAPWMALDEETIREEGEESVAIAKPWMETPIDFAKIRSVVGKSVAIFSDNDPFVPLDQQELFKKELNADIIIEHNMGHFAPDDNITELPSALNASEEILGSK
ncbi:MAG: alpha/beta hydrolase [Candidatus Campbellbacteria bacterium]|nr:alpha/beta hydrolase [Candidatus Campbellbacteria bacterium]